MGQLNISVILEIAGFAGGLIWVYTSMQTKLKELDMKIIAMEQKLSHVEKQDDKIMEKLESISEQITEVKIKLETKQDK